MIRDQSGKIIGNSFIEDIMKNIQGHYRFSEIEKEVLIQRLKAEPTQEELEAASVIVASFKQGVAKCPATEVI